MWSIANLDVKSVLIFYVQHIIGEIELFRNNSICIAHHLECNEFDELRCISSTEDHQDLSVQPSSCGQENGWRKTQTHSNLGQ